MLFDFLMGIPYYLARFFVPDSVWEIWLHQCKVTDEALCTDKNSEEDYERFLKTFKARAIRRRWPLSY